MVTISGSHAKALSDAPVSELLILGSKLPKDVERRLASGFQANYYELPYFNEDMKAYLKTLNSHLKKAKFVPKSIVVVIPMAPEGSGEKIDLNWIQTVFSQIVRVVQYISQGLMTNKGASQIILVQTSLGQCGHPDFVTSSTFSGANVALIKCLAKELGRYSVSANVISVLHCDELNIRLQHDEAHQRMFSVSGLGGDTSVEKINSAIRHLVVSEMSVTGQVLNMDGGTLI